MAAICRKGFLPSRWIDLRSRWINLQSRWFFLDRPCGDVVGIDFGTTSSDAAVLMNQTQLKVTSSVPSKILLPDLDDFDREVFVGGQAFSRANDNPRLLVSGMKRLIGRKVDDLFVQEVKRSGIYEDVITGPDDEACVVAGDITVSPTEFAFHVMMRMMKLVGYMLERRVSKAVLSVPQHYAERQIEATVTAARLASIEVLDCISEPLAAYTAFDKFYETTHDCSSSAVNSQIKVIVNVGGATTEVTVLKISHCGVEVIGNYVDLFLGGEDFDASIVDFLVQEMKISHLIDGWKKAGIMNLLRAYAEDTKIQLSTEPQVLLWLSPGRECIFTRIQFETLVQPLIERINQVCMRSLEVARVSASEVDEVFFVGGMTFSPIVQRTLFKIFGKLPRSGVRNRYINKGINPNKAVCIGAAYWALSLVE